MECAEIQTALAAAVVSVLETMCFMSVEASGEGPMPPEEERGGPDVVAGTHFRGSPSGGFQVGLPIRTARAVSAGFLGREEAEVSDGQAGEVVCELVNMICGSVLSRLESETEFHIGHPELLAKPEAGLASDSAARWFDLGDGLLTVAMRLDAGCV